jgi:hypothetical protein
VNLRPLVNDKVLWTDFLEEIDQRIMDCYRGLEQASDPVAVYRYQGEIAALKKLKYLREKVNNVST